MTVTAAHMTNGHKAPAPPPAGTAGPTGAPRLAAGVELLGTYQNSGYSQPPSLVRRPDGQVIQMSSLLYQVTSRIDGSRDPAAIADLVSADIGRSLTADQVRYLITAKLMPLGIVGGQDAPTILPKASPLLALRARCTLLPELRRQRGRRHCCGRCSGGRSSWPWSPASRPWTTGCSPPTVWVAGFSRSCAIPSTCSLVFGLLRGVRLVP